MKAPPCVCDLRRVAWQCETTINGNAASLDAFIARAPRAQLFAHALMSHRVSVHLALDPDGFGLMVCDDSDDLRTCHPMSHGNRGHLARRDLARDDGLWLPSLNLIEDARTATAKRPLRRSRFA